jgi:hypothetical protein
VSLYVVDNDYVYQLTLFTRMNSLGGLKEISGSCSECRSAGGGYAFINKFSLYILTVFLQIETRNSILSGKARTLGFCTKLTFKSTA